VPPRKITDRLIVIVSAAVFAVFAQQAGADQNLHCCALRFSDTESFTYSTTLLGIEKEDFAFSANRGYIRRILLHQIALFNPFHSVPTHFIHPIYTQFRTKRTA